jgi:hypothetical protein
MADPTVNDWAEAIESRLETELDYGDDVNGVIARLIKQAIIRDPSLLDSMIGTFLIEDSYFLQTRTVTCKVCGGSIALVGLTEERKALGHTNNKPKEPAK